MKTLFTHKGKLAPFMEDEIKLLKAMGEVRSYEFKEIRKLYHLIEFIRQLIHILSHRYDVYYCFFGDYHGLIPILYAKLRGRKSVIVVAGYDAMRRPDLNYGIFLSRWRGWIARVIYKHASHILTNSNALQDELRSNRVKLDERFQTVYFGYYLENFKIGVKENICLMVGVANDYTGVMRKGYDRFLKLAELLPMFEFICVGLRYGGVYGKNMTNYPSLPHEEVLKLMSVAKIYLQPSRAEGFSSALTEAMLSGCRPIVSNANGIPENYNGYCYDQFAWDMGLNQIAGRIYLDIGRPVDISLVEYAATKFDIKNRAVALYDILLP